MIEADNNQLNDGKNDPLFHYGNPPRLRVGEDSSLLKLAADLKVKLSRTLDGYIVSGERDQLDQFRDAALRHYKVGKAFHLVRDRDGFKKLTIQAGNAVGIEITSKEGKRIKQRKTGTSDLNTKASNSSRQPGISEAAPKLADTLICLLLPKKDSMIILGDLVEDFKRLRAERGVLVAKTWYWRQTLSAIRPVLQHILIKAGALIGAEEFIRRIL